MTASLSAALSLAQQETGPWTPADYGSDRLAEIFFRRAQSAGLFPLSSGKPWFPYYFKFPETLGGMTGFHWCGRDVRLRLPSVLVQPVRFYDVSARRYSIPSRTFHPYYTSEVIIDHPLMAPPRRYRDVSVFEAIGILLAYPALGSVRTWDTKLTDQCCQVYFDETAGRIVVNAYGSDIGHHRAYVSMETFGVPQDLRYDGNA